MRIRELIVAIKVRADIKGALAVDKVVDQIARSAKIAESSLSTLEKATTSHATAEKRRAKESTKAAAEIERAKSREVKAYEKQLATLQRTTDRSISEIRRLSRANQDQFERLGDVRSRKRGENRAAIFGEMDRPSMRESIGDATSGLARGAGRVLGGLAVAGGFALSTAAEMQSIEVQIEQLWGSKPKADAVFGAIKDFAKQTPFDLQQVTGAFVDFKIRGLEPTQDEMTALGDLASTFKNQGGSLGDLTSSIAAMLRGENDPIEKYGISAKAAGDKVVLTFGDQKIAVDKTMESITAAMVQFGKTKGIAGAMATQVDTLGGAWSNFKDNLTTSVYEAMKASGALDETRGLLGDLTATGEGTAGAFGEVLVHAIRELREWLQSLTKEQIREWLDRAVAAGKSMISMVVDLITGLLKLVDAATAIVDSFDETGKATTTLILAFGALIAAGGGLPGLFAAVGVAGAAMGVALADAMDDDLLVRIESARTAIAALKTEIATLKEEEARIRGELLDEATTDEELLRLRRKGAGFGRESEAALAEAQFNAAAEANRSGFGEELFASAAEQAGGKSIAATGTAEQAALARAGAGAGLSARGGRAKSRIDAAKAKELDRVRKDAKKRGEDVDEAVRARQAGLAAADVKARKAFTEAIRKGVSEDDALDLAERTVLDKKKDKTGKKAKKTKGKDLLEALGLKGPGSILDGRPNPQALTIQTTIVTKAADSIPITIHMPPGSTLGKTLDQVGADVGQAVDEATRKTLTKIVDDAWSLRWKELALARGGGRVPKSQRRGDA